MIWIALACLFAAAHAVAAPLSIFVSVAPQRYFVERIGGDRVAVEVLVGPGQSPATLDPTARRMAQLARADLFIRAWVPFEKVLMERLAGAHEGLGIVDPNESITPRAMEESDDHDGDHDDGDHDHGELDPHVWLSPKLAATQAENIARALTKADSEGAKVYGENLAALLADLDRVDRTIAAALADLPVREFFVFHPAYGYFADRYGLTQVAVETGGKEPGARALARLIDRAKAAGVKIIFVQPQFSQRSARAIADAVGAAVVEMDPLSADYLENLEAMAQKLTDALGGKAAR